MAASLEFGNRRDKIILQKYRVGQVIRKLFVATKNKYNF